MSILAEKIAAEIGLDPSVVERVILLFDDGDTIPFMARYRKEVTGGMTEEVLGAVYDSLKRLLELASRKEVVLQTIQEQGALTDELRGKIIATDSRAELEDLFLPYRAKPVTRATKANEAGLGPLADMIMEQGMPDGPLTEIVRAFINPEKGITAEEFAWTGARDICAERISAIPALRRALRKLTMEKGMVVSRFAEGIDADRATKYREYQDFSEPARTIQTHRTLALRRGEKEGFLAVRVVADREAALAICRQHALKNLDTPFLDHLEAAIEDAYDRLLAPALEGDVRNRLRDKADAEAMETITRIVRQHLMTPPFGPKRVMGIAADERKGSRIAMLDEVGQILEEAGFSMGEPVDDAPGPVATIMRLVEAHKSEAYAIGKNTPGRDVESLLRELMKMEKIPKIPIVMLTEAEAGVYAGGPVAREEMPDKDGQIRRAASFGRRLQDPHAELAKTDPRAIGSTPYHHDVDRSALLERLERVMTSCVSAVGAEANRASRRQMAFIAGAGPQIGGNLVKFREEHGPFRTRSAFHQVKKMSPKAFEQCCAFLRIEGGENPLDRTSVHPERYALVAKMAEDLGVDVPGLLADPAKAAQIEISRYIDEKVGEPTLRDVIRGLSEPWKDPRGEFTPMEFDPNITKLTDLKKGMTLKGVITNVIDFGAFVDVGVQHEGLVHLSQLSHKRVISPYEMVAVGQPVTVMVTEVDLPRQRLSLSIKAALPKPERPKPIERPRPAPSPVQAAGEKPAEGRPPREGQPSRRPPAIGRSDGESRPPRGGDGRGPRTGEARPPRGDGSDRRPQRPAGIGDDRGLRPPSDRDRAGPRREDFRPGQQRFEGDRSARPGPDRPRDTRDRPQKKPLGPEPFRPFANLKLIDGQIIIVEEKKPKEK